MGSARLAGTGRSETLKGLQLFGECHNTNELAKGEGYERYAARFPAFKEWIESLAPEDLKAVASRFFRFEPTRIKILDELEFGEEVFIEVSL